MRDVWIAPPGDDGSVRRAHARDLRHMVAAWSATIALFAGSLTYATMKQSTEVSTADVLARFRTTSASAEPDAGRGRRPATGEATAQASRNLARHAVTPRALPQRAARRQNRHSAPIARSTRSDTSRAPSSGVSSPRPRSSAPAEGVYEWRVDGIERGPGVERRLPSRSHRVITHKGPNAWVEHHIFSEEKEMWFDLVLGDHAVYSRSSRNRVVMGPVTTDRRVTFAPPVIASRWPFRLGRTWSGEWSGKTSGTYSAKTFEHTWLTIRGERVEVWASEIVMEMRGEVEGRVVTRTWVAPEYDLAVKQYQETDVRSGPASYYSRWTGQTLSLTPQT